MDHDNMGCLLPTSSRMGSLMKCLSILALLHEQLAFEVWFSKVFEVPTSASDRFGEGQLIRAKIV